MDGVDFTDGKATPDDVDVAGSIRGPSGSRVSVTVERDGKSFDYILTREPIKITSVRSYVGDKSGLDGKIGLVRIKSFSGTTAETVKSALGTRGLEKEGCQVFRLGPTW